jgi:arylsulfatase A-like enzyme
MISVSLFARWARVFTIVPLLVATCTISCTKNKGESVPRNVLLIVVDTLRQDHLGCYGYDRGDSKTIDELARRGVMFTQARSPVPLTLPSFTSIFTSTYPVFHKIRQNETYSISDSVTTLAEVFKEKGVKTKAVVGSAVLASRYGLDQGFDHYDDKFEKAPAPSDHIPLQPIEYGSAPKRSAQEVVRLAVDWLEENSADPFFLFLHFFDPHLPFDTPEKLPREKYSVEELPIWAYDSEIASVDMQLGVLMSSLEELDLTGNTLVVFTADHGEGLMEHMEASHGYLLYDSTIRVPMIFSCPGILPQGKVLEGAVRTIDLMPTLLDIFGLEPPARLHGISLKEQILGDVGLPRVDSYFETYYGRFFLGWSVLKGVEWNEWKYIQAPKPELYHLREDPGETVNLIEERPEIASSMRERLNTLISTYSNPSAEVARSVPMDAEHKEVLESLGYFTEMVEVEEPDSLLPDPKDMMEEYNRKQLLLNRIMLAGQLIQGERYDASIQLLEGIEEAGDREWMIHFYLGLAYMGRSENQHAKKELLVALDQVPIGPERVKIREALRYLETRL